MDEVVAGDSQTENGRIRERHEIYLSESVGIKIRIRMIRLRLPVFLSKDEEGASVGDRDNFFFGP